MGQRYQRLRAHVGDCITIALRFTSEHYIVLIFSYEIHPPMYICDYCGVEPFREIMVFILCRDLCSSSFHYEFTILL